MVSASDPRIVTAIELLRKAEPGTFVIRDSSSYRGSFGLALKVQEPPASAQSRPGMHVSLLSTGCGGLYANLTLALKATLASVP